jgi:hypothetical protein
MVSSGMLRRVALVINDVSVARSASFIRVTRIGELGTTLAVISNRRTSVLTRATRRNIPEDTILHSHCRENLKSCIKAKVFVIVFIQKYYYFFIRSSSGSLTYFIKSFF